MKKAPRGRRNPNTISGAFAPRLIEMHESPAWRVLTASAKRLLERVELEHAVHAGKENGRLKVTYQDFVNFGVDRHSVKPGLLECAALGFLEITKEGRAGNAEFRSPSEYRLTYRPADSVPGDGSHEWRKITSLERAKAVRRSAREASLDLRKRTQRRLEKQNTGGENSPISVGIFPTEIERHPVGKSPTTPPMGNSPPLSIFGPGATPQVRFAKSAIQTPRARGDQQSSAAGSRRSAPHSAVASWLPAASAAGAPPPSIATSTLNGENGAIATAFELWGDANLRREQQQQAEQTTKSEEDRLRQAQAHHEQWLGMAALLRKELGNAIWTQYFSETVGEGLLPNGTLCLWTRAPFDADKIRKEFAPAIVRCIPGAGSVSVRVSSTSPLEPLKRMAS